MFILRMPSPPIYCDLTTLGTYSEAVVLHLTFNTISRGILICRRTPPPTTLSPHPASRYNVYGNGGCKFQFRLIWTLDCSIPKDGERVLGNLWFLSR